MMNKYSSGISSDGFWNNEFKKYLSLLQDGYSASDIMKLSDNENVFQFKSATRAKRVSRSLKRRVNSLPAPMLRIYPSLNEENKLLVNYIGIMLTNRLVAEFTYEVYREEIILGDMKLRQSEVMSFLLKKQGEDEQVANWTHETVQKICSKLIEFLKSSELLETIPKSTAHKVTPILLDYQLENVLKSENLDYYLQALGG